jgi:hypothetical protein
MSLISKAFAPDGIFVGLVGETTIRQPQAEKIGQGFKLTSLELRVGKPGQLSESKTQPAKAA